MPLTQEDLALIAKLIASANQPAPADPSLDELPPGLTSIGPLDGPIDGMDELVDSIAFFNAFSAKIGNRFTKSAVYDMMAKFISAGIDSGAWWTVGSVPSWRYVKEAFQTRSSQLFGDKMTTGVLPVVTAGYGETESLLNKTDIVIRRLFSMFSQQAGDRDLGPDGEQHTTGECVRICYVFLDAITDEGLVPNDAESNFTKVKAEVYDLYDKLGEGVFGPFTFPPGYVPPFSGGA